MLRLKNARESISITAKLADGLDNRVKNRAEECSDYVELSWLPATSVLVERLFSSLKCMLGSLRKSMSAETLETIVCLRMNWDLVSDKVVSKPVKEAKEEDEEEECDTYW